MNRDELSTIFFHRFKQQPTLTVSAPGRINLIGEHTDYNDGFVLPAAIGKYMYCAMAPSDDDLCIVYAIDLEEFIEINLNENIKPVSPGHWGNYIAGVIAGIQQQGHKVKGFRAVFTSTIPLGAGLSSSAALEVAFGFAISQLQNLTLAPETIARIGQAAEHRFAGVACGIMDQFASSLGKQNQMLLLDCRTLAYEYIPADLNGYQLILFDTNIKHELASSAYNQRRQECETGVSALQQHYPAVQALRDATLAMLPAIKNTVSPSIYNRCRYVIEENSRVKATASALRQGDLAAVGNLMYASHQGLTELYEVSCAELDYLISLVKERPEVLGARMMGGGFGGCTINLVKADKIDGLTTGLQEKYFNHTGITLSAYLISLSDGVKVI